MDKLGIPYWQMYNTVYEGLFKFMLYIPSFFEQEPVGFKN